MTPNRLLVRVGNRGIVLSLLGFIWIITAIGIVSAPLERPGVPDDVFPPVFRAAIWGLAGVVALIATWWKKWDALAWGMLILPVGMRLFSYLLGWVLGTFPPGWRGICVYAATALLVNRCAKGLDRPAPWDGRERRWTRQQQ